MALADHRNELLSATSRAARRGGRPQRAGRCDDLAWSPDGAWIAYTTRPRAHVRHQAVRASRGKTHAVTRPEFRDFAPAFDPQGQATCTSCRCASTRCTTACSSTGLPRAVGPTWWRCGPAPGAVRPRAEGPEARGRPRARTAQGEAKAGEPAPLRIDLDGIGQRIAAFPVAEDRFGKLAGVAQGKVVWTVLPIEGEHGRGGHKEGAAGSRFDFETQRTETLMAKVADFSLARRPPDAAPARRQALRAIAVDRREDRPERRRQGADARERLDRPRARPCLGRAARRMAADVPRGVAAAARAVLGRDMSGIDWDAV